VEAVTKNISFCKILCSYGNDNCSECLNSSGLLPFVSGQIVSSVLKDNPRLSNPENEDIMILQNVMDYKPDDVMSHPRITELCYTSFGHFITL
jgi:hypothetical protein